MKVYLGTDHAGFDLKEKVKAFLKREGYDVEDCGAEAYDKDDDYPVFIGRAAKCVSDDPGSRGIVFGGSGQGEAMVANRFPNVRCAVFYGGSKHALTLSRQHNDANLLSLGSNFVTTQEAKDAVLLWLHTDFSQEERHIRRIQKIERYNH